MKDIGDAAKFLHPDCAKENSKKGGPQQTSLKQIQMLQHLTRTFRMKEIEFSKLPQVYIPPTVQLKGMKM